MDDDPERWTDPVLVTIALVLSAWGGIVSFLQRVRRKEVTFSILGIVMEVAIATFTGLTAFFLVRSLGGEEWISGAAAALFGHWGGQGLQLIEVGFAKFMQSKFGIDLSANDKRDDKREDDR